jgi:hypothetical protein
METCYGISKKSVNAMSFSALTVRAENLIHGSDQQTCSPGAPVGGSLSRGSPGRAGAAGSNTRLRG